jgi:hypothetical protein
MPIPDERLPQIDELVEEESNQLESAAPEPIAEAEEDELEFETADVDATDDLIENDEAGDRDTASFGYGDPAD